jgi:hypothetical protein
MFDVKKELSQLRPYFDEMKRKWGDEGFEHVVSCVNEGLFWSWEIIDFLKRGIKFKS